MTTHRSSPESPSQAAVEQFAETNGHHKKSGLAPPSSAPTEEKRSLDPGFLWSVFVKWWYVAVPGGLVLAAGVASLVWYLHTPMFRASIALKITDKQRGLVSAPQQTETFSLNQRVFLRLPFLLNKLLQHEDIAKLPDLANQRDPVEWLRTRVDVRQEGASNMLMVSCEMSNAANAAKVLDTLIDEYFIYYLHASDEQTDLLIKALKTEAEYQLKQVGYQQETVNTQIKAALVPGSQVPNPFHAPYSTVNPKLQALFNEFVAKQVQRESAEVQLKLEQEAATKPIVISDAEVDDFISAIPHIRRLENDIRVLKAVTDFPIGSAAYQQNQETIATLSGQVKQSRDMFRKQIPELKRDQIAKDRREKTEKLRRSVEALEAEITALRTQVNEGVREDEGKWPARLTLNLAQIDLERAKNRLSKIDDELWLAELRKAPNAPSPVDRVQKKADVPKEAVEVIPYKKMAGFSLAGLLLPFSLCVLREFFTRRLFRSQQVSQELKLQLLGEVATIPKRPRIPRPGASRRFQRDRSVYEESVDSLRATLAVCDGLEDAKVLVVASSVSGEGKSTLAARLAFSYARGAGEKVLLIDADLRAPDLHKFFQIDEDPGLGQVLLGERRADEVTVDFGHGLFVMPAGRVAMSPHRLFSNGAFRELIAATRGTYERVVIDVPPILGAGESLQIAKEADGVLFCARKDVSRIPQLKMACSRLELSGACVLGCVFIGATTCYYSR